MCGSNCWANGTGLTLACDLARRGVAFRIVDKAAEYFAGSRGKGLQPRSLELLDNLGVIGQILDSGRFHVLFRGYDGAKVIGDRGILTKGACRRPMFLMPALPIPQFRVEEILRRRLAELGHQVELATELTGFEQSENEVHGTLVHEGREERVKVSYLIGADGGKSFGLLCAGRRFRGRNVDHGAHADRRRARGHFGSGPLAFVVEQ